MSASDRRPARPRIWLLAVYLVLFALVIPWYWPAADSRHVLGFPLWAIATLAVVFLTSMFTAWVYLTQSDGGDD